MCMTRSDLNSANDSLQLLNQSKRKLKRELREVNQADSQDSDAGCIELQIEETKREITQLEERRKKLELRLEKLEKENTDDIPAAGIAEKENQPIV
jgi:chromosome segregation ATPase